MFYLFSYDKFEFSDFLIFRLFFVFEGGGGDYLYDWLMYRGYGGVWWGLFFIG